MKDRDLTRPFSVPLYPVLPAIFCLTCAWMLYSAVNYAGWLALIGFAPAVAGLALFLFFGRQVIPVEVNRRPPSAPHP
jgi:hypothetical protein